MLFAYNTMSRIALISDIHANLPALEAVMKDIEQLQCNAVYCLGDVVGYNANPSECLEFIRSRQIPTVRGNHDEEAIGEDNPAGMNPVAYNALMWTRQQLSEEQKKWLRRAPFQRILPNEIVLVHATQDKPNSWAYVTNVDTATICCATINSCALTDILTSPVHSSAMKEASMNMNPGISSYSKPTNI